jgi:prevent-host-death family protein
MMKTLPAAEAKNHFGHMIDMAQADIVTIEKKGRPVVVVMSIESFQHYEQLENELWALKAAQAEQQGFLSTKESEDFLKGL